MYSDNEIIQMALYTRNVNFENFNVKIVKAKNSLLS